MSQILLLEPDRLLGSTYQAALQSVGHEVMWCLDAQTAVDALGKMKPELVITELQLAKHNGIEFLYELRSYADWQKLPVIVLSYVSQLENGVSLALWDHIAITAYHYKPLTRLDDLIRSVDGIVAPHLALK